MESARRELGGGQSLPICEVKFVQPDRVRLLPYVAILLVIDGDAIPIMTIARVEGAVQSRGLSVERDRLVQQLSARGALDLDHQMIPRIVDGVTWDAGLDPMGIHVVPDVPFMASGNAAFMSPDMTLAAEKLIDVEFQRLRHRQVVAKEVDVVNEVVHVWHNHLVVIGNSLR